MVPAKSRCAPILMEFCQEMLHQPVLAVAQWQRTQQSPEDGVPIVFQQVPDTIYEQSQKHCDAVSTGEHDDLQHPMLDVMRGGWCNKAQALLTAMLQRVSGVSCAVRNIVFSGRYLRVQRVIFLCCPSHRLRVVGKALVVFAALWGRTAHYGCWVEAQENSIVAKKTFAPWP